MSERRVVEKMERKVKQVGEGSQCGSRREFIKLSLYYVHYCVQ
jgi:hypothetical protein